AARIPPPERLSPIFIRSLSDAAIARCGGELGAPATSGFGIATYCGGFLNVFWRRVSLPGWSGDESLPSMRASSSRTQTSVRTAGSGSTSCRKADAYSNRMSPRALTEGQLDYALV